MPFAVKHILVREWDPMKRPANSSVCELGVGCGGIFKRRVWVTSGDAGECLSLIQKSIQTGTGNFYR